MTRLLPPFRSCTTCASDSLGRVWMIIWTWSRSNPNSPISHRFIWQHCMNSSSTRLAILPINTRRLYFGQNTRWVTNRCFVDDPVQYSVMNKSWQKMPPRRKKTCVSPGGAFLPALKRDGDSCAGYWKQNRKPAWSVYRWQRHWARRIPGQKIKTA